MTQTNTRISRFEGHFTKSEVLDAYENAIETYNHGRDKRWFREHLSQALDELMLSKLAKMGQRFDCDCGEIQKSPIDGACLHCGRDGDVKLSEAICVPDVAMMYHALLVWDQAMLAGRNEPLVTAYENGQFVLKAIKASQ